MRANTLGVGRDLLQSSSREHAIVVRVGMVPGVESDELDQREISFEFGA